MSRKMKSMAPFFSILMLISTLLVIVMLKIEVRQQGYAMLRLNRVATRLKEENRNYAMIYSRSINSNRLRILAQKKLTLSPAVSGQILQVVGHHVALQ